MNLGDLILLGSIGVALWYVPRYLWRVYGGPDVVKYFDDIMSRVRAAQGADERTDGTDEPRVSAVDPFFDRLQLDRTKTVVIEILVYSGWTTGEIRSILKGENAAIGAEVEAARQRLGIAAPERTLRVRDGRSERVIPL